MTVSRKVAWAGAASGVVLGIGACAWFLRPKAESPGERTAPAASATQRQRQAFEVAEVVFDRGFGEGWQDFGWGPRDHEWDGGALRVGLAGYGGVIFRHAELSASFGALVFKFRAPKSFGDFLAVSLQNGKADEKALPEVVIEPRHVAELDSGWREVMVPLLALNPSRVPFDRIVIRAREMVASDWVELDAVALTKPTPEQNAIAPTRPAKLSIDCRGPAVKISPLIYGIARGSPASGATAFRIGGNRLSRHNWEIGATNIGSDWFFENVDEGNGAFEWLAKSRTDGTKTAIVVPTIGWVAKDDKSVGFPVSKLGKQQANDPHRPEAGNGVAPDGKAIAPGPPTETSIAAPPELVKAWIERVRKEDAAAGARAVDMYLLDNEPDLWHVTHRDVHPEPLSYDELLDRTIRYGTAIRSADPEAVIAGPTSWGWPGYFFSALDMAKKGLIPNPDRASHGGTALVPWYLRKLAEHERQTGVRVLDVLDVHFYPQADGVCQGGSRTDPKTVALRLRSTRALWDASYKDESWIGEAVRLVPRLKEWVEQNYPGRGISLGEWSFCAEDHISGGLAIAEALGRFGQYGLTAAFYWGNVAPDTPAFWAYRAYRNFDGKGGRFLDVSLPARGTEQVSLFASRDEASSRLVLVALNLDPSNAAEIEIDTSSCGSVKLARRFGYGAAASGLTETPLIPDSTAPGALRGGNIPPYAMAVLELTLEKPR